MIKVGFIINASSGWMGGVNYFKNLLYAISVIEDRKIEPVVFMGKQADQEIKALFSRYATVIETDVLDRKTFLYILWRAIYRLFGSNLVIETVFKQYGINIWSHSCLAKTAFCKNIEWIPDFQHLHLPAMFSEQEHRQRNKVFTTFAKHSDVIVLSSHDALKDYCAMFPAFVQKARVLQFVSQPDAGYFSLGDNDRQYLQEQYHIDQPYFYMPNQFWKHKNHRIAFEAVNLLKQQGIEIKLVCTGYLDDYRNTEHLKTLTDYIKSHGLENNISLLGLVPYKDVFTLMRFSRMVINPSLFEGWSSTVEECKGVGKMMVLSDLDVHREQFPQAIFFRRDDAHDLAEKLGNVVENPADNDWVPDDLAQRTLAFANAYQHIVLDCLGGDKTAGY